MAREKPNSSPRKRIKARDGKLPSGYSNVSNSNFITAARPQQLTNLTNTFQGSSIHPSNPFPPQNDATAVASNDDIEMVDYPQTSDDEILPVAAAQTVSGNSTKRRRSLTGDVDMPAASTAGGDIKGIISGRGNVSSSVKRHKTNMTSFHNITKSSSTIQKVAKPGQGVGRANTAITTKRASRKVVKSAADLTTSELPISKKIKTRRLTKRVYVTKDFLAKWQVKPMKRPFGRPQIIADTDTSHGPTGVSGATKLETDWFSKILGFGMPGFQEVVPFFATFEFDPEIDAKILKGLKASATDKDLKGVSEVTEEPEDEDESNVYDFTSTKISKDHMIYNGLDLSLPPMHSLPDIFEDMVSNGLDVHGGKHLQEVVDYLKGGKLRIGTMCSGTECPILALGMINDALTRKTDGIISFNHIMSCEIEPYKQAYIQRNFDPEFLFRDVTELPQLQASTAYGSPVNVPGNLDMIIAGSSCKDYSGLNNKKKTFNEEGQSRSTFQGVLGYAQRYTPRIVILENVDGAPWLKIQAAWDEIGYETFVSKVDTKDFYIPQTRRRGYMVGFNREIARIADFLLTDVATTWSHVLEAYARRASSPFTKFIYSEDDPRLHQLKRELSISQSLEKPRSRVDWHNCRHRYMSFRAAYRLGFRKPLTMWENNGTCRFPDGSWLNWAKGQVERIWDTTDINLLRCVGQRDYDLRYKIRDLELSQNIDRDNDTRPWGIIGCVTPSGIPYLTTRGGPITGPESLALQGIPTEKVSLTYETSRQLQDFAGNAMTSTVVGAAILAALGVGHKILERGPGSNETPSKKRDTPLTELILDGPGQNLRKDQVSVASISEKSFKEIRDLASSTMQLCSCEGRFECNHGTFQGCLKCGHRTCTTCGQNPLHEYKPIPASISEQRKDPSEFEGALREWLPLQLLFDKIDYAPFSKVADVADGSTQAKTLTAIKDALRHTVHMTSFSRTNSWAAIYESPYARLEIVFTRKWENTSPSSNTLASFLGAVIVKCYLYAKARAEEPANSSVRANLAKPIARMTCNNSAELEGDWEIRIPKKSVFDLKIEYSGEYVDSWEKALGLKDTMFSHRQVSKEIKLSCSADSQRVCPEGILGFYELLRDCGTACGSLYRKVGDTDFDLASGAEPVFFFLDPGQLQNATEDSFVFATTHHQPLLDGARDVISEVKKGWRPVLNLPSTTEIFSCKVSGLWEPMRETCLNIPKYDLRIQRWLPNPGTPITVDLSRCTEPDSTALVCSFPLQDDQHKHWTPGNVYPIALIDKPNALRPFTHLIQRAGRDCGFKNWVEVTSFSSSLTLCKTCAPTKPRLVYPTVQSNALTKHLKAKSEKPFLVEDQRQAFEFEKKTRARPSPVIADLHCHEDGTGTLKLQLNAATLIHRAHGKIVGDSSNSDELSSIKWRLAPDSGFQQLLPFPKLSLLDNAGDSKANMPPNWNKERKLHTPQLRSLRWMLEQESKKAEVWVEQEIEEARIPSANLRLEAKVECTRHIRGGVLADEVGYGKTAVTLALFDSDASNHDGTNRLPKPAFAKGDRKIKVKATLVLAPAALLKQWHSELNLFLLKKPQYVVLVIDSEKVLLATNFERIAQADLILSTWDVFGDTYFEELAYFGRSPQIPKRYGRAFQQWLSGTLENIYSLVEGSDGCKTKMFWPALRTMCVIKSGHQAHDATTMVAGKAANNELDTKMKEALEDQFKLVDMKDRKDLKIAPLLHFFSFRRIVTDEFTYVKEKCLAATLQLTAPRKWILSGTPPLGSFREINSMALFLGTKLSTDDNDGGVYESQAALKEKMKEKTEAEKFHFYSYQTLHSPKWYHKRHKLAEKFVAKFIRQNPPDLTEVPLSIHYEVVSLSAAERATYFELFQLLMNRPMAFSKADKIDKKVKEDQRDRTKRLVDMASTSRSPEEALLICCSTTMSTVNGIETHERTASKVCKAILAEKKKHFHATVQELTEQLIKIFELWQLGYEDEATVVPHFHSYIRSLHNNEFGDEVAKAVLDRVMAYARAVAVETAVKSELTPLGANNATIPGKVAAGRLNTPVKGSTDEETDEDNSDQKEAAEEKKCPPDLTKLAPRQRFIFLAAAVLTNLSFRVVEHLRGLRFFNIVDGYVKHGRKPNCSECREKATDAKKTLIMGLCGHASCTGCFEKKHAQRKLLDECVAAGCEAPAHPHSAFRLSDLDRGTAHLQHPFGSKIDAVLELLQNEDRVGTDGRVVIFVQFVRLKAALIEGLKAVNIKFVDGSHKNAVEKFKKGQEKVCILDPESVNAAGWNLQMANHVIFLSPLVVDTQYKYTSMMIQARGRVYRQGQKRGVHVYHFLAARTMDVNILQDRTGETLVQRDGKYLLLPEAEVEKGDMQGLAGAPFEGAACRLED